MAYQIKILGRLLSDSATTTTIYTVPSSALGALVNNIRIVNTDSTNNVNISVRFHRSSTTVDLVPPQVLNAKKLLLIKPELTLQPNDYLTVVTGGSQVVHFTVFGSEKTS